MQRISTANRAVDLFGPGKDGFRAAMPGVSDPTSLSADFMNGLQESILGVIERAGLAPSADHEQLADAIEDLLGSAVDALQVADYASLRTYTGPRQSVYVMGSGIAGMFVRDDSDTASTDDGGTVIVASNGKRWKRAYSGRVNAQWFGAKGDGVADDTGPIQSALAKGAAFLPPGSYLFTATLSVDYSKSSLHGDRATLMSSVPAGSPAIKVFSSATYGADGKDPYTKNYMQEACKGFALVGTCQTPAPAGGAGFIGWQIGQAGSAYSQSGDAQIVDCPTFGFDTQVLFADNGWRVKFKECALTAGNYPIWFSNPNNAGEVMVFEGCWIVGWAATLLINGGYFVFHRCSLFGSATGLFVVQDSADVTLRDCNVEVSNNRASILFSIETTSRLILSGGSLVFDGAITSPVFQGDSSNSMLTLENVSLPLYGSGFQYEQNAWGGNQVRALVQRGTSLIVQARGCFPKAGVDQARADIQAVIGGRNRLANGDAERGNLTPWLVGGGTCAVSTSSPRNGSKCFTVTVGALYQDVKVSSEVGRWFAMGVWVKALAGSGTIGNPKVQFLDSGGNSIAIYTVAAIDASQTTWEWYAYNWTIPEGADVARVILDGGAMASASLAFDDAYFGVY